MTTTTRTIEVELNDGTSDHLECDVELTVIGDEVKCVAISSVALVHPCPPPVPPGLFRRTAWDLASPAVAEYSDQIMRAAKARYAGCAAEIADAMNDAYESQRADEDRAWRKEHAREAS